MNEQSAPVPEVKPPVQMSEFNVNLGDGAVAIVVLPLGITALQMLRLIAQLPEIGSRASVPNALDRILVPRR